jgi:hypothetical protein
LAIGGTRARSGFGKDPIFEKQIAPFFFDLGLVRADPPSFLPKRQKISQSGPAKAIESIKAAARIFA